MGHDTASATVFGEQMWEFGPFRLDVPRHRLLMDEQPVALPPKAFDTLVVLLQRRERVVEKRELMELIWPGTFVEEANLTQTIFVLRKTLGNDPQGRPYIVTVPRRGYRFVGEVAGDRRAVTSPALARPRRERFVLLAVLAAGVIAAAAWYASRPRVPSDVKVMLAVLPFENLSGDPAQDYFSNGLTEEMITHLGQLDPDRLGVIARGSSMQYGGTAKDARQVGAELGVDYLLEGSVRRDAQRVRIVARLVQASNRRQVWTDDYDRDLRDVLAVQADVAAAIAQQVRVTLTPDQTARLHATTAVTPEAFENYLQGRFFWNKRTVEGHRRAIEFFEQAIALDPAYAKAYAGLADAYALLGSTPNDVLARPEAMSRARAAAEKALSLDDRLPDAHASLGFVKMHFDWDFPGAEREFRRSIALNPGYATAHHWYAYDLVPLGRLDDAIAEVRLAQRADPLSVIINRDVAEMLLFAGRVDEAIAQCEKTLEMDPAFSLAHFTLGMAYDVKGESALALDEIRKVTGLPWLLPFQTRDPVAIQIALADLGKRNPYESDTQAAGLELALGDIDAAFAALDRSFKNRDGGLIVMAVSPEWRRLRGDPRFVDLMRRVGVTMPRQSAR